MTVQTRIYVPLAAASLRGLRSTGRLEPAPFTAYAVTTDLRRGHPGADGEELEYLAFTDATSRGEVSVVAAADVDADLVTDLLDGGPGGPGGPGGSATSAVRIASPVSRRQVASFHVVNPGSGDYSWYDATELEAVVDLLR